MQKTAEEKAMMRRDIEKKRMDMEKERLWSEKAEKMCCAGSSAPADERLIAERLIRKRVLSSLEMMMDSPSDRVAGNQHDTAGRKDAAAEVANDDL